MNKAVFTKPMNCVIYIRVSSDLQIENYSLDTQEKICREAAERLDYKVLEVFREEGESAKTANRPELVKLLDYCRINKAKVTSVLAYKIDRIARETSDYLAIRRKLFELGIKLESATEPTGEKPVEKFIETLLAANAQLDNEIRGERARNGLRARFKSGLISTHPPVGYLANPANSKLPAIRNPKLFNPVKDSWDLMGTGTKSLSEMAKIMNAWGIRTTYGKRKVLLTKQAISKIFKNKFYAGWLVSKTYNEEIRGQHEPMITEALFYRVQDVISGRRTDLSVKRRVNNPQFPLRGIVKCFCGVPFVAGNCKGRNKTYAKYWCPRHSSPSVSSEDLDEKLRVLLNKHQPSDDAINLFTLIIHKRYSATLERLEAIKKNSEKKLLELKQQMILLVEGHLKGLYPDDIYKEEKLSIEDRILAAQIVKNDNLIGKYDIEGIVAFIKALLHDLPKAYEVSDYGQKRVLLGSIWPSGLLFKEGSLLNRDISPMFRAISEVSKPGVNFSAGDRT